MSSSSSSSSSSDIKKILDHTSHVIDAYVAKEVEARPDDFGELDLSRLRDSINDGIQALISYEELRGMQPIFIDPSVASSTLKAINAINMKMQSLRGNAPLEQKKKIDFIVALAALEQFQSVLRNVIPQESEERRKERKAKVEKIDTDLLAGE